MSGDPLHVTAEQQLLFHQAFEHGQQARFKNGLLELSVWTPVADQMRLPAFDRPGNVWALMVVTSVRGGNIDLAVGENRLVIRLASREHQFLKPILTLRGIETAIRACLQFEAGDALSIAWNRSRCLALSCRGQGKTEISEVAEPEVLFVGVITESG